MLSETTLRKQCKQFQLSANVDMITRLGRVIRDRQRKMLTMGPEHEKQISYDVTPIHKVNKSRLLIIQAKYKNRILIRILTLWTKYFISIYMIYSI